MGYIFLTSAKRLLGSYLIRDLTRTGTTLTRVARSTELESAPRRAEVLIAGWQRQARDSALSPVELEIALSHQGFVIGAQGVEPAAGVCHAFRHLAALLTSYGRIRDSESYRSMLRGTRYVLRCCRQAGMLAFPHALAAYVFGDPRDRVSDSEADIRQDPAIDGGISKLESEQFIPPD